MRTRDITVLLSATIRDAMRLIDLNRCGIVLVTDEEAHLIGTITDGDVRRAVLEGESLDQSLGQLLERKQGTAYPKPTSVKEGTSTEEMLAMMHDKTIQQLPVLDEDDRVIGLVTLQDLMPEGNATRLSAVVMAGGRGTRLHPLTLDTPKPMLRIGDRPILELIIDRLKRSYIKDISITTNYLEEQIRTHFRDGAEHEVNLSYVREQQPLGTAGSLTLMERPSSTMLVINGDIITDVDFQNMLTFHRDHSAKLTVGTLQYDVGVPFGVLEFDGPRIARLVEKPSYAFYVNGGIYLIEPEAWDLIPKECHFNMTDLIERLVQNGEVVVGYPVWEYWLDIGNPADYKRAQEDMLNGVRKN